MSMGSLPLLAFCIRLKIALLPFIISSSTLFLKQPLYVNVTPRYLKFLTTSILLFPILKLWISDDGLPFEKITILVLLAFTSNFHLSQYCFNPSRHFCRSSLELANRTVSSAYNVISNFKNVCMSAPGISNGLQPKFI